MRHYFYKYLTLIVLVSFGYLFNTCASDTEDGYMVSRTVLIYISVDNYLVGSVDDNFEQIKKGYDLGSGTSSNLLVYMDKGERCSNLYRIYKESGKVKDRIIHTYNGIESSSVEGMSTVFRDVYAQYPASGYGLILSFHGAGWLPENELLNSSKVNREKYPTRGIMQSNEAYVDVKTIAKALDNAPYMDFIIFDACLMGSAEVAYELRDKSSYMVASPTEVHAGGFPYNLLVKRIFMPGILDYKAICDDYVDSYLNKNIDDERSKTATMSAINIKAIDDFRTFVQTITDKYKAEYNELNPLKVQPFDRLTHKVFFDAQDLLYQLPLSNNEKTQLKRIMSNLVIYKRATPYFINLPIDKFSGVSLGYMKYQMKDLKSNYMDLKWNKKTGR